ncbi:hypothetical protein [Candidatus Formimonas warabiya]|uniref:Uncharacterized protein n=1 Tax=Formimonas warabiya TaxID=1761012 RepID=A0A3G1KT40_FORW1|nr:hypothetical protein [Candidatus Formimonas warabiya]ATW25621.1 hypothetical protein DCMF_13390 [Candidatus Formimonas warabiya]
MVSIIEDNEDFFTTLEGQLRGVRACIKDNYVRECFDYVGNTPLENQYSAAELLGIFYSSIPKDQRYDIVLDVYMRSNHSKNLAKYVRAIKKYRPSTYADDIKTLADSTGNIVVYRGGVLSKNPDRSVSWTTNINMALFFTDYCRRGYKGNNIGVYMGNISIDDVIAYTNDRNEYEILQYGSVKNIIQIG